MKLLNDEIGIESLGMEEFHTREIYLLTIVGGYDSPLGPRRKMKPDEFRPFGEWISTDMPPKSGGYCLVEGDYVNDDDEWPDSVLPAWWDEEYREWTVTDGAFRTIRQWMPVPYLPNVWASASARYHADMQRFTGRQNSNDKANDHETS